MRTLALVCIAGMWVISFGFFVASGVALRAALRRRLVLAADSPDCGRRGASSTARPSALASAC